LNHVIDPVGVAMVTCDDGAQKRQDLAQQLLVGVAVAVLRGGHQPRPLLIAVDFGVGYGWSLRESPQSGCDQMM
jgi:hypothetical protein